MSNIKFTVEDSKVSEILKVILNSGVVVSGIEVANTQYLQDVKDSRSSVIQYQHDLSASQNKSTTVLIPGVRFVGGTIFYIDDTADGEYQFFGSDGNLIENVQVGDKPYYYKVIKKGSKDKYYVYHDEVYDNMRWTYCKDDVYVCESLGTSINIRSGKTNTETVMAKDSGAYITVDSNGYSTIWYQLQQLRNDKVGGCDDWFVPSAYEVNELRVAIKSGSITGGTIAGSSYKESAFSKKWLWSSSEDSSQRMWYSWIWGYSSQNWCSYDKDYTKSVFFTRAF